MCTDEQHQPQHGAGRRKHVASFRVPSDSDSDAEEGDLDLASSRHQAASMASSLHPVLAATSGRMRSVQREFAAAQEACRAYLAGPMQDIAEDLAVKMQDIILHVDARKVGTLQCHQTQADRNGHYAQYWSGMMVLLLPAISKCRPVLCTPCP